MTGRCHGPVGSRDFSGTILVFLYNLPLWCIGVSPHPFSFFSFIVGRLERVVFASQRFARVARRFFAVNLDQ